MLEGEFVFAEDFDFGFEFDVALVKGARFGEFDEFDDVGGFGFAEVAEEIAVDVGDGGVADLVTFESEFIDELARGNFGGIFERAA